MENPDDPNYFDSPEMKIEEILEKIQSCPSSKDAHDTLYDVYEELKDYFGASP